jgi:RNA-directed DNA polymerase
VQVRCTEGLASHSGPESCAGTREGSGEALTGVRAGQPLSRERLRSREPTRFETWKAKRRGALWRALRWPGVVVEPGMCGGSLYGNREILGLIGEGVPVRIGKARSHSR